MRNKEFLLEVLCPIYGKRHGRFWKANGSWDGRGNKSITHNAEFAAKRKGSKHFNDAKRREAHLSLPRAYRFYDESF